VLSNGAGPDRNAFGGLLFDVVERVGLDVEEKSSIPRPRVCYIHPFSSAKWRLVRACAIHLSARKINFRSRDGTMRIEKLKAKN
jgi:hypothetical protein